MDALIVVAAIAIVVIAFFWIVRKLIGGKPAPPRVSRSAAAAAAEPAIETRWRAVRIVPGLICCKEVSALREQVFLSRQSPSLPLETCTERDCRCKYVHLEDRRSGQDRRVQLGELDNFLPFHQTERRRSEGRRAADLMA